MSYLSRIETERDELRMTVQQLLAGWNRMVDDIAALKKERDEYHNAIVPWKERTEQWASSYNEMENERNEWREKYEMSHADHVTVTRMWGELKTENDALKGSMQRLLDENADYKRANASLTKHHKNTTDDLAKCSEQYAKRKTEMWHMEQELSKLVQDNALLQQQVALLEIALAECAGDKALLEREKQDDVAQEWQDAPSWANWYAVDSDGAAWWYEKEPRPLSGFNVWEENGGRLEKDEKVSYGMSIARRWQEMKFQRPAQKEPFTLPPPITSGDRG